MYHNLLQRRGSLPGGSPAGCGGLADFFLAVRDWRQRCSTDIYLKMQLRHLPTVHDSSKFDRGSYNLSSQIDVISSNRDSQSGLLCNHHDYYERLRTTEAMPTVERIRSAFRLSLSLTIAVPLAATINAQLQEQPSLTDPEAAFYRTLKQKIDYVYELGDELRSQCPYARLAAIT